jgi:hypothetical protein
MSCACLERVWHGKSSLDSSEAQGQLVHHQCSLMSKDLLLLNGGVGQVHGRRWEQQCMEKAAWRTSVDSVL